MVGPGRRVSTAVGGVTTAKPPPLLLPGDKSLTHRALVLAALATGVSEIEHPLASLDTRSMAGALRQLGVDISPLRGGTVRVIGKGLGGGGFLQPSRRLNCGNSGTAARFLLGLLAACPWAATVTGDASLRRRPMRRIVKPLRQMGASFTEPPTDGLPIEVRGGALRPIEYRSEVASAQLKSAVLLAGLVARVRVRLSEPLLSRDHTERMLRALGVPVESNGTTASLTPVESIPGFRMDVPGDPSAAAFLVAAALLAGREECVLRHVAVNPTRTGFLAVLKRMGARIAVHDGGESLGEPVGDLVVGRGTLRGTTVTAEEVPALIDEIPVLAVLAAAAAGVTTFHGVSELRVKETDRLGLLAANLRVVGVQCEADEDSLTVEGTAAPPKGAVETGLDHRMAMAFAVLGRVPGAAIRLSEYDSPGVSYPGFFDDLDRVAPAG